MDTTTKIYPNETLFMSVSEIPTQIHRSIIYNVCIDLPPPLRSDNILAIDADGVSSILQQPLTILELQIITIFLTTQFFHFFLKRLGLPYFFSSVMAGLFLGPTVKIEALDKVKNALFPFGSEDVLSVVSILGYTFHLFVNCVQMDFSMITRTGRRAWTIALSSVLVPISVGFLCTKILFPTLLDRMIGNFELIGLPVVFIAHSGCNFQVVAALLNELQIINSELGRLALAAALVSDITSNIVNGIGTAVSSSMEIGFARANINLVLLVLLVIFVPMIARPAMRWVVLNTPEGKPVRKIYIYVITFMVLILGMIMHRIYQPVFAGAIVLGLSVPEGPPLGSALVNSLDVFATWLFFPVFVTCCVMKVDLTRCNNPMVILVLVCFVAGVQLIKVLTCMGICRLCKMRFTDGICIGLILSCKGAIDICSYVLVYDAKKFNDPEIGVTVVSVLVLGSIARYGVKVLYDPSRKYAGYQKRNILNLKPNAELRIIACIQKPCHIIPIRNALEFCFPTTNKPIVVDILHLMELVGRSSPIFISHRHQKSVTSSFHNNFSGDLIVTFNLFEHDYAGVATVNTYTVISPIALIHEDICYVAMDTIASLIILPFHVKWGEDGSIESVDNTIRSLNTKVMEKAPCSIGILLNRGSSKINPSSHMVAMIFIGGQDDREALCLAKRSIKESNNNLYVYRLLADSDRQKNWEIMLDDEVLREIQGSYGAMDNVVYEELYVDDASHTTSFIHHIASKFDLIIVGRRHGIKSPQTDALETWTEFPELGAIGDLLASPDMDTKASVLVVQQQQLHQ